MAKTGLNFGEKLQIVDKSYRVITDALKLDEVFGKLTFRSIEGAELIYEALNDLGLNYREEVELTDIVVTYSAIGRNDNYRLYASAIKKKGAQAAPKSEPKAEDKK